MLDLVAMPEKKAELFHIVIRKKFRLTSRFTYRITNGDAHRTREIPFAVANKKADWIFILKRRPDVRMALSIRLKYLCQCFIFYSKE